LNAFLRSIRQSYLSTAHPPRRKQLPRTDSFSSLASRKNDESKYLTDQERTQIDAQAKQVLRELNASISQLSDTEQIRQNAESTVALKKRAKRGLGGLGRWAAGGAITAKSPEELEEEARANAVKMHRENVIWYLQRHLEETGRYQSDMMEIRLTREVEKSKSILYKARGVVSLPEDEQHAKSPVNGQAVGVESSFKSTAGAHADELDRQEVEQQLSPEQLQLFQQENVDMLKHYEDTLDQVR
jgi:syntaxin 18